MSDLIDRQYALEHYQYVCRRTSCKECPMHTKSTDVLDTFTDCELELFLYDLPSVQPEPRWIPIDDRLPTQEGEYLVCDHNERVFIAKFWTAFGEWGYKDIIAWQETPEPYREETDHAQLD